ncbi:sel1 repeat family protein [Halosquirtibacter laminarini]|uniref:Sel1 repeat family protein n=1 Tax=Halosquirtibacter laminarini TaxID=3374600 RepID=A0AC61NBU5_9BACT|nr:sel1 repeat family protein [Prolixibacteraceae bacterium]
MTPNFIFKSIICILCILPSNLLASYQTDNILQPSNTSPLTVFNDSTNQVPQTSTSETPLDSIQGGAKKIEVKTNNDSIQTTDINRSNSIDQDSLKIEEEQTAGIDTIVTPPTDTTTTPEITISESFTEETKSAVDQTEEDIVVVEDKDKKIAIGGVRYQEAIRLLYEEIEVEDAYTILHKEALNGDIAAQLFLALYPNKTTFNSLDPSLEQIFLDANEEDAQSQYLLGKSYLGNGYIINLKKSISWLQRAKENRNIQASILLSKLTLYGIGVEKSQSKAFKMLLDAAKRKDTIALRLVANAYIKGAYGQKTNPQKAIPYLLPIAQNGQILAQRQLGKIYYKGRRSKSVMWYTKASTQGDIESTKILADLYYNGTGVVKNYSKAKQLYTQLASQSDMKALTMLGDIYFYGKGVRRDYNKACQYYLQAMEHGATSPATNLSRCYDKGWGVKRDHLYRDFIQGKASKHYKLTPEECHTLGSQATLYSHGAKMNVDFSGLTHYRIGRELEKQGNFKKAFQWNKMGAQYNHDLSHLKLGEYYIKGLGIEVNRDSAFHHFIIAAAMGNKSANQKLTQYNYQRVNPNVIEKDIKLLEEIAYHGNKRVAIFLSRCYKSDKLGVVYNIDKSSYWQKIGDSKQKIISLNKWTQGQWKDLRFITKQAYAQNREAQTILGYWYLIGIEDQENLSDAIMWLESALSTGDQSAALLLSQIYYYGYKTIMPDKDLYNKHIEIASKSNNPIVKLSTIELQLQHHLTGSQMKKKVTTLEKIGKMTLSSSQRRWLQWIQHHPSTLTSTLDPDYAKRSQNMIANILFYGPYPVYNPSKSMLYYQIASKAGSAQSMINLAYGNQYHLMRQGTASRALFHWRTLSKENQALAKPYLYRAYSEGIGTRKNRSYAKRYKVDSVL